MATTTTTGLQISITGYTGFNDQESGTREFTVTISTHPEVAAIEQYWTRNTSGEAVFDAQRNELFPEFTEDEWAAFNTASDAFINAYNDRWDEAGIDDQIKAVLSHTITEAGHHRF